MRSSILNACLAQLMIGVPAALACLGYEGGIPTATAHYSNKAVIEVKAGEVFNGEWAKYDRGSGACSEQSEGKYTDAVFVLYEGATLKNVIIGKDQAEGVHCKGHCTLEFVWFEDVCEDAISIVSSRVMGIHSVALTDPFHRRRTRLDLSPGSLVVVPSTPMTRSSSTTAVVP